MKLPAWTRFWCKANKLACLLVPVIATAVLGALATSFTWARWVDTTLVEQKDELVVLNKSDKDRMTYKDGMEMELRLAERIQRIYDALDQRLDNLPQPFKDTIIETRELTEKNSLGITEILAGQKSLIEKDKMLEERMDRIQTQLNMKKDKE